MMHALSEKVVLSIGYQDAPRSKRFRRIIQSAKGQMPNQCIDGCEATKRRDWKANGSVHVALRLTLLLATGGAAPWNVSLQ